VVIFIGTWFVAFLGAAALNSVMRSDNPVVIRRGRVAFTLLLAIELLWVPLNFEGSSRTNVHASRGLWWGIVLGAGIPIALALGLTVRRAYAGHRIALISALGATVALFLAFPLGYVPPGEALTGLGRFEHDYHALDIVALLVPTLILLVSEVRRGHIEGSKQEFTVLTRLRLSIRAIGIGGAVAIAFILWLSGAAGGTTVAIVVVLFGVGVYVYAEVQTRVAARRMQRDLKRT
jgi:hypothetical protein